jgi:hypothetical protein
VKDNERSSGQATYLSFSSQQKSATVTDVKMVGFDLNTFFGFSLLYSLKKSRYGKYEELPEGQVFEDKYWILLDMVAKEGDIADNEEYLQMYYDQYMGVLNQGGLTLVAPRYASIFHGILYHMALCCNTQKMAENRNEFMSIARKTVMTQVPGWAITLGNLRLGCFFQNRKKHVRRS